MQAPNVIRTLAIVRRLADGEKLRLPDGYTIAMAEDMSIGFALQYDDGTWHIGALATMDLAALDALLTRHGIGQPFLLAPTLRQRDSEKG